MSKNIVICCDGTGNEFGDTNSNVVKLYSTLFIDRAHQVGYYRPGVGTMGAPAARTRLEKAWSIVVGMAFGAGILDNIGDAYRYLMNCYEPGDNIYLFGFSRGSYTVRALAGLLHMYGLLYPGNEAQIPYILRMYSKRSKAAKGMVETLHTADAFKATFSRPCPLHFVGVWDTVSSVGWITDPLKVPYTARNPDMKIGRHAVSIDERRCYFRNNLWGAPFPGQDIKQVWFAGVHSDVGGGYPETQSGLAKDALAWMLREAKIAGLIVVPAKEAIVLGQIAPPPPQAPFAPPNPLGPIHESLQGWWWVAEFLPHTYYDSGARKQRWRIPLGARRVLPADAVLHSSVLVRKNAGIGYHPDNLPPGAGIEY